MTDDVPFYVALALEADGPIVEFAVGNGRVAVPVASATGRRVTGMDIPPGCSNMHGRMPRRTAVTLW